MSLPWEIWIYVREHIDNDGQDLGKINKLLAAPNREITDETLRARQCYGSRVFTKIPEPVTYRYDIMPRLFPGTIRITIVHSSLDFGDNASYLNVLLKDIGLIAKSYTLVDIEVRDGNEPMRQPWIIFFPKEKCTPENLKKIKELNIYKIVDVKNGKLVVIQESISGVLNPEIGWPKTKEVLKLRYGFNEKQVIDYINMKNEK